MANPAPEVTDYFWSCPLLKRQIAEGHCLDINYQLLRLCKAYELADAQRETGKSVEEISLVCEACPNQPLRAE
jgi:hypothetical protein